jgi:L-lactate utilization protein LutC
VSDARETFLARVRAAVAEGNRAGAAPVPGPRGPVGYQGAGPDPVATFARAFTAAGGQAHLVPDPAAARAIVLELVRSHAARRVLLGRGPVLDALGLAEALRAAGVEVLHAENPDPAAAREAFFGADLGISGVDSLVAETGTLVLASRPDQPRSLSLLPPVHVAVADRGQIVPDLFDLFSAELPEKLPAGLSLITGPSKTGDIELRLVTGVHGPGEVHAVVLAPRGGAQDRELIPGPGPGRGTP